MDVTRRHDIMRMTSQELAIACAMANVEDAGAHPLLTDAVVLLQQAREKVADFVDQRLEREAQIVSELVSMPTEAIQSAINAPREYMTRTATTKFPETGNSSQ